MRCWNDAQSLILLRRGALLFCKVCQISRSHGQKNRRFWPELSVSGLQLQVEFTNGYKMMHKAWSNIAEVPYCFSRSSVKFQGQTGQKIADFDPNWAFPDCNSRLSSPMATKWCTKLVVTQKKVPYCLSRSSVKFQGHTVQKITDFDPNWAFPDCNFSLNSLMAMKWCIKLEAT